MFTYQLQKVQVKQKWGLKHFFDEMFQMYTHQKICPFMTSAKIGGWQKKLFNQQKSYFANPPLEHFRQ